MKLEICSEANLLSRMQAIRAYFNARKSQTRLPLPALIHVLKSYFELVVFRPLAGPFVVRVGSDWIRVQFDGHDAEGQAVEVGPFAIGHWLVLEIAKEVARSIDPSSFQELVELNTSVFEHPGVPTELKLALVDAENGVLRGAYEANIWSVPSVERLHIDTRKRFVLSQIEVARIKDPESAALLVEALSNAYGTYASWQVSLLISAHQHDRIIALLTSEIAQTKDRRIVGRLVGLLLLYNNLFVLTTEQGLKDILSDFAHLIPDEMGPALAGPLAFSARKLDVRDAIVECGEFGHVTDFSRLRTTIYCVALCDAVDEFSSYHVEPNTRLTFVRLSNPTQDPVYLSLIGSGMFLEGLPLAAFSDTVANAGPATLVVAELDEFYHPDFEVKGGNAERVDFTETVARLGRMYYPYKERLLGLLRQIHAEIPDHFPLLAQRADININLLSNHLVAFLDPHGVPVYSSINLLTNLDSIDRIKAHYRERMNELVLSDVFSTEQALMSAVEISSSSWLRQFVVRLIEESLGKPLSYGVGEQLLWDGKTGKPMSEVGAQAVIELAIKPLLALKHIKLSREPMAAGGNVDFLCSDTRGDLYTVCVEVKNGHNDRVDHGVEKQLPAYMDSERTRDGVYLVLWYKNRTFPEPSRYETPEDMKKHLMEKVPQGYRISVVVIDCNKQPAPSKL